VIEDSAPAARHVLEQYANNRVDAEHGRRKARLRPMRGLNTIRSLRTMSIGHAFVQNPAPRPVQHHCGYPSA
jgi:transposase-like protein